MDTSVLKMYMDLIDVIEKHQWHCNRGMQSDRDITPPPPTPSIVTAVTEVNVTNSV